MTVIYAPIDDKRHQRRSEGGSPGQRSRFVLEHIKAIRFDPTATFWLLKGLLPTEGLACIYGPPKSYKSFIANDLSLAIARAMPWAGRRATSGAVIYVGCEGAIGIRKRLHAYKAYHHLENADFPFFFIDAKPNLGVAEGDAPALVAAIEQECLARGISPVLVVIDTLARTLFGAAENAEGMTHFCDNAEAIGHHFKCLALAVHHSGKNTESGMRGHSSLLGAVVTSWRVEKVDDMHARVTIEASKDGEDGVSWDVRLEKHAFAVDEDGEDVASLVVSEVGEPTFEGAGPKVNAPARKSLPATARAFVHALDLALGSKGRRVRPFPDGPEVMAVSLEDVRDAYYEARADEDSPEAKRRAFNRAKNALVDRRDLYTADVPTMGAVLWKPE